MDASWETLKELIDDAYRKDDYPEVLRLITPVLDGERPLALTESKPSLCHYLQVAGYAAQNCDAFDQAVRWHEEAVAVARVMNEAGYSRYLPDALHYLGDAHIQRDEPEIAAKYLKESLRASQPEAAWKALHGENPVDLHIVFDIGQLAYYRKDIAEAREYLEYCRQLAKDAQHYHFHLRSLEHLLALEARDGSMEAAKEYYWEALNVADNAPTGQLFLEGHPYLGYMADRIGETEHAYYHFSCALRDTKRLGDLPTLARLSSRMSAALAKLKRFDDARKHAEEALAIWKEREKDDRARKEGIADASYKLGRIHSELKRFDTAAHYFVDAATGYRLVKELEYLINSLAYIGWVLWRQRRYGRMARLFGALEKLSQTEEYKDAFGDWAKQQLRHARFRERWLPLTWRAGARMTLDELIAFAQESVRPGRK